MLQTAELSNPLKDKILSVISRKPNFDKDFSQIAEHISSMSDDSCLNATTSRKLYKKLEQNEIKLAKSYLAEFEKINNIVQKFDQITRDMSSTFLQLHNKIGGVRMKNSDLLSKTNDLQHRKRMLEKREEIINSFIDNNSISEEENNEIVKCEETGRLTEDFFNVMNRVSSIRQNCKELVQAGGHIAAFETMETMQEILERGKRIISDNIKREFSNLSLDTIKKKQVISKSFLFLQSDVAMLHLVLDIYVPVRSNDIFGQFLKIDHSDGRSSKDTLRLVNDNIANIHEIVVNEKELINELLALCTEDVLEFATSKVLAELLQLFIDSFKIRVEKIFENEKNPVVLCQISKNMQFCSLQIRSLIKNECGFSKMLESLAESVKKFCVAEINFLVGTMSKKIWIKRDVQPAKEVHACLELFNEIFENLKLDIEQEEQHTHFFIEPKYLFEIIIEPLIQAVQVNSTLLLSNTDVAIFTINCLKTIRLNVPYSVEFSENLEKIDAMIESNSDVLVSEKTSDMLRKSGLMPIYKGLRSVEGTELDMSTIPGLEIDTVRSALIEFTGYLHSNFDPTSSFSGVLIYADIRRKIRERCIHEFNNVYELVVNMLEDPKNGYKEGSIHYLPMPQVSQLLNFDSDC